MLKRSIDMERDCKRLKVGIWLDTRFLGASLDFASMLSMVAVAEFLLQHQDDGEVVILTREANAEAFGPLLAKYPERLVVDLQEPTVDGTTSAAQVKPCHWETKARDLLDRKRAKRERIYEKSALQWRRVAALQERASAMIATRWN